jgi:predicted PurR-regulated permease PerM
MSRSEPLTPQRLLDVLLRAALIAVLAVFCYRLIRPFLDLLLWSAILAIALYPLEQRLRAALRNRDGLAASLVAALSIVLLLVPLYYVGASLAESAERPLRLLISGGYQIPPPPESVAGWPLIGDSLYELWLQASTDLTALLQRLTPQLRTAGLAALGTVAGIGVSFVGFVAALILAAIFMAYGESGSRSALRIFVRISGPERGPKLAALCTATIRAVAQGVVGIAFIQSLLLGIGFVAIGIPGAGLLALAALLLGITQLPVALLTLPVIVFVLATQGTSAQTVVFAVYIFFAGLADNVLKPLLLGRGLEVPMPVVLLGALGGMVMSGIIGLFIGPVILALGYALFWQWVEAAEPQPEPAEPLE